MHSLIFALLNESERASERERERAKEGERGSVCQRRIQRRQGEKRQSVMNEEKEIIYITAQETARVSQTCLFLKFESI